MNWFSTKWGNNKVLILTLLLSTLSWPWDVDVPVLASLVQDLDSGWQVPGGELQVGGRWHSGEAEGVAVHVRMYGEGGCRTHTQVVFFRHPLVIGLYSLTVSPPAVGKSKSSSS